MKESDGKTFNYFMLLLLIMSEFPHKYSFVFFYAFVNVQYFYFLYVVVNLFIHLYSIAAQENVK